jgi:hypothetical protein
VFPTHTGGFEEDRTRLSIIHFRVVWNLYSAAKRVPITDLSGLYTLVSRPHRAGGFEETKFEFTTLGWF